MDPDKLEALRVLHNICWKKAKEYEFYGFSQPAGDLFGVCKCLRDIAGIDTPSSPVHSTQHAPKGSVGLTDSPRAD